MPQVLECGLEAYLLPYLQWPENHWMGMQCLPRQDMNGLFERLKHYLDGARILSAWIGDGSHPVSQEQAQARANVCLECERNQPRVGITESVASAIKETVDLKNALDLMVDGELGLKSCEVCDCPLRLKVWVPLSYQVKYMREEEIKLHPAHCWLRTEANI